MNDLHKAFTVLGLEPGAPFDMVKRRYRRLVLVWHPDRMTNVEAKREAEEELKKINNSFDKLKKHFETEHKSGPRCRCQPAAAGPPPNYNSHAGPDPRRQEEDAERKRNAERARQASEAEAARKRNEERQRQAAAEEAAQRAAKAAHRAQEKQKSADEAIKAETSRKDETLRWKCAVAGALTFAGLVLYCWIGCGIRDAVHEIGRDWENFQSQFKSKPGKSGQNQPIPNPYIEPYNQVPGGTESPWSFTR
jgi:cation transport ATPase